MTRSLKIIRHADHTEVEILRPCGVRSMGDDLVWVDMLEAASPAGTVYLDFASPAAARRSYAATVNGRMTEVYHHDDVVMAFVEMMLASHRQIFRNNPSTSDDT